MRIRTSGLALLVALSVAPRPAMGQPSTARAPAAVPSSAAPAAPTNDAEPHFRRGVSLYKSADYANALVEFRRAYELSPNFRVLYNVGQSLYQLGRYAEALGAFERYLAEGGAQIQDARRAAVEKDVRELESRVGRVKVTVNLDGAEVRIDDEAAGTTPLAEPLRVSMGHRKITIAKAGHVPLERFVDVAAGDVIAVAFEFATTPAPAPLPAHPPPPPVEPKPEPTPVPPPTEPVIPAPEPTASRKIPWIPWAATGVLAAGTAVTGALTLAAKSDLSTQLARYPGDPTQINSDRNRGRTLSYVCDGLLAGTAVAAGIALYFTLKRPSSSSDGRVGVAISLQGVEVRGQY